MKRILILQLILIIDIRSKINSNLFYFLMGKFSIHPVIKDKFVLMDFLSQNLNNEELLLSPPFLSEMDLGSETYFVKETSQK